MVNGMLALIAILILPIIHYSVVLIVMSTIKQIWITGIEKKEDIHMTVLHVTGVIQKEQPKIKIFV